jgi:hypothetical protein
MAANPIKQKLLADIEQAGGWEQVLKRVASGESQTSIAASFGVTQGFLSRVIHLDAERVRAFREAKRLWAITLVERTGELVHNVKESRDSIAKVREVAAHNRWEAGKWDRELFGEDKGDVNVNVLNIGALHVEALRHRMIEATPPLAEELQRGSADAAVTIGDAITAEPLALPAPVAGEPLARASLGTVPRRAVGIATGAAADQRLTFSEEHLSQFEPIDSPSRLSATAISSGRAGPGSCPAFCIHPSCSFTSTQRIKPLRPQLSHVPLSM